MIQEARIAKILYSVLSQEPQKNRPRVIEVFVAFLRQHRMLHRATRILAHFERYALDTAGEEKVVIETARRLPHTIIKNLTEELQRVIKKTPILEEKIRPDLIGGIRLHIGETVVDGSMKRKLRQLFSTRT